MATAPRFEKSSPPVSAPEPVPPARGLSPDLLRKIANLCLLLCCGCLVAFTTLQYQIPGGYNSLFWGLNPLAVLHWGAHLHIAGLLQANANPDRWDMRFRSLVALLWLAYAGVVAAGYAGAQLPVRRSAVLIGSLCALFAVFCPPLLTTDCYAYVAYARMLHLYGANPYLNTPYILAQHHDPVASFLVWNLPSVYGPIWTWLSTAFVAALPAQWLWGQVVAMKLIAGAALIGAAFAAKRIAEHFEPKRGALAFAAVGLNPLMLIEGPGNGHNDLLLVCLILVSFACFVRRQYPAAGLALGLAVGVKLIPLALLPWMLISAARATQGRTRARALASLVGGSIAPSVIGYIPLWHGMATLRPILTRSTFHLGGAAAARAAGAGAWLNVHGIGGAPAAALVALWQHAPLIAAFAAISAWFWRSKNSGSIFTAWAAFCACLMFWAMGIPFPWYIAWFWPFLLIRFDRATLALSAACFLLSAVWIGRYATLLPISWFHS